MIFYYHCLIAVDYSLIPIDNVRIYILNDLVILCTSVCCDYLRLYSIYLIVQCSFIRCIIYILSAIKNYELLYIFEMLYMRLNHIFQNLFKCSIEPLDILLPVCHKMNYIVLYINAQDSSNVWIHYFLCSIKLMRLMHMCTYRLQ